MVVFGIGMGTGLITGLITEVSSSTATADATTQSLYDINVTMTNNTAFADPVSQVTAMTAVFGEPFYVLRAYPKIIFLYIMILHDSCTRPR